MHTDSANDQPYYSSASPALTVTTAGYTSDSSEYQLLPELTPLLPFNPDSVDLVQDLLSEDPGFRSAAKAAVDNDLKVLCTIYTFIYSLI